MHIIFICYFNTIFKYSIIHFFAQLTSVYFIFLNDLIKHYPTINNLIFCNSKILQKMEYNLK